MQFSSRPPFNDDPMPFENRHGRRSAEASTPGGFCSQCVTEHNPTNPILECFRDDARESIGTDAGGFIETMHTLALHWLNSDNVGDGYASDAQKEHADRVLARLVFFQKESA